MRGVYTWPFSGICSAHVVTDLKLSLAEIKPAEEAVPLLQFGGTHLSCGKIALILIASELLLANALVWVKETLQHLLFIAAWSDLRHLLAGNGPSACRGRRKLSGRSFSSTA